MVWSYLPFSINRFLRLGTSRADGNGATALTSKALSLPLLREAMPDLRIELSRARRYERPLSVLLFTALDEARNGPALERSGSASPGEATIVLGRGTPHLSSLLVGALLRDLIRQTDHIAYAAANDRLVIAFPETGWDRAHQALRRIEPEMKARVKMSFGAGIAVFPDDGFTFPDLMERADRRSTSRSIKVHGAADGTASPPTESEP